MNETIETVIVISLMFMIFGFVLYVDKKENERLENVVNEDDIELEIEVED